MSFIQRIILIFIVFALLEIICFTIFKLVVIYRQKYKKNVEFGDFGNLIEILHGMIAIELDLYEKEIFSDREGITNANFKNFYHDLCLSIQEHISEDFMKAITVYITEEFVYTLIARKVKSYLASKVN